MIIPKGNGVVSNRQTSTGQVETSLTQQATSGFSSAMGFVNKYNEEKDRSQIQEAVNAVTKKTNDWKAKNLTRTGKDAAGLTEEFLSFNKELENEYGANLSKNGRSQFSEWNVRASESDRMGAMVHEDKQANFVKQAAFTDGLTIAEETIRTDAKAWPKAFDHMETTLELGRQSGVIKEEEFETKRTEITNKLRTDLGKNYYTQDKHDFMKNINQFGFGEPEIAAYKSKYKNDLAAEAREQKSLFAEEANLLFAKRDDMKAQATENGDTSHYMEGANRLRAMGFKEKAMVLEEDAKLYGNVINFQAENKGKPLKEVYTSAKNLGVGLELDGSSIQAKSNKAIQDETIKQVKIFNSDPAQYVSKWSQGETMEEIANSRLSLQKGQGFYPDKGFKILTQEENKNFKGAWESGDMAQKTDLVMESFRYGKHTSRVLDETGINSALALAPMIGFDEVTGQNKRDVEMLVAGVSSKPEMLDTTSKSDYGASAKESDFYKHLVKIQQKFPTNPDLPQKMADLEKAMTGISARKVDPGAGAAFFDGKIETVESSDKLVYFPKSLDSDEVEDALDKKKEEFVKKFSTGDKAKDRLSKWAIRDATWVNTSSGFVLTDPRSGAYLEGSQFDMIELEPLKKELANKKLKQSGDLEKVTFMRR